MPSLPGFQWTTEVDESWQWPLSSFSSYRKNASGYKAALESLRISVLGTTRAAEEPHWFGLAVLGLVAALLILGRRRSRVETAVANRGRSFSNFSRSSQPYSRKHLGSIDSRIDIPIFGQSRGRYDSLQLSATEEGEYDDFFEFLALEDSLGKENPMNRIHYFGPQHFSLVYESLVPPPSWLEVSRQVMPPDKHFRLQRYLVLTPSESSVVGIHQAVSGHTADAARAIAQRPIHSMPYAVVTKKNQEKDPPIELPMEQVSLFVPSSVESGVVHIYVKDSPREEWMEHTLASAADAAQFQADFLALQTLGPMIYNMFQTLQLIHQGSIAYKGKEFVWHDDEAIGNDPTATDDNLLAQCCYGVAWDDCLRCFGSTFPSVRLRLEALWWKHATEEISKDAVKPGHRTEVADSSVANVDSNALKPEYVKKRLLLGPIDFFRLFVPQLPDTATPRSTSSKSRVQQMFRWRKRVARASVLVNAYCEAREVVNRGWILHRPVPDTYWKRRMAFDDNTDNSRWDTAAENKNEYYEGTVSRDIVCQVRGNGFGKNRSNTALSLIQGYSLVGVHTVKVSSSDKDPVLRPEKDPVLTIPTLRSLVESHPELDFFVSCFHIEAHGIWHIAVFVRSLPEGVDSSFDDVVKAFKDGGQDVRDKKLELILHLGVSPDLLQWKTWFGVKFLSLVSFLTSRESNAPMQRHISGDRTALAALRVSSCGSVSHFGGSLQPRRSNLPLNYVAHIATLSSRKAKTIAMRTFLFFLERPGGANDVLDVSYILAGENASELPERVLGSYRMVQMKSSIALSASFLVPRPQSDALSPRNSRDTTDKPGDFTLFLKLFVTDPFLATVDPVSRLFSVTPRVRPTPKAVAIPERRRESAPFIETSDPLEQAVNEMIKVLEPVQVLVRREQLQGTMYAEASGSSEDGGLVAVPITEMTHRDEIRRFFVSSRCSHAKAAMRLVETVAWRGRTFPIDIRVCRIELQTGQFFQQGYDKKGNPVFYFRSMCLGPWRKDENAAIAAVLHRLERAIEAHNSTDPNCRFTIVTSLGKPHVNKKNRKIKEEKETGDGAAESSESESDRGSDDDTDQMKHPAYSNPRVEPDEIWSLHSSKRLVRKLINIIMDHYPERLYRAYVVVGHGNTDYARTAVGGFMRLSKYVRSPRTRDKVKFLIRYSDLREYISPDELIAFCGGSAAIQSTAFECQ